MSDRQSGGCGVVGFLAIIALIVIGMFAGGWIYLKQTDTETQIIIDKEKVKSDTTGAVNSGKQLLDNAAEGIDNAAEGIEEATESDAERTEEEPNADALDPEPS